MITIDSIRNYLSDKIKTLLKKKKKRYLNKYLPFIIFISLAI